MKKKINLKNKKILVAGGSGLLGTNITELLIKSKAKVLSSFNKKKLNLNKKYYKKFDFLDMNDCIKATKNKDIVFIVAVKASGMLNLEKNFFKNNLNNIKLRLNLLEACKMNNVQNIVWVSSSTVYQPLNKPIRENEINYNIKPYKIYLGVGTTYRYLEEIFMYYLNNFKMKIKIIRTSSIYGPFDDFNLKTSHVIPALIRKAVSKKNTLDVLGDPFIKRDFVYVKDLAKACVLLSTHKFRGIINFSAGNATSIEKLSKKILKLLQSRKKIRFVNKQKSSAKYRVLNNAKYNKLFKNFKRTELSQGLLETINWYLKNEK